MSDIFSSMEHKCEKCGKLIYTTGEWVYKIKPDGKNKKMRWFCSYTCWRNGGGGNGPKITRFRRYK